MEKEYLLREKPLKALWLFALPMMVGNLFQQFYTMADSMIVGRFVGEDALAAIGASYALTNVFICIAIGGGVGAGVLTGRYFGAREYLRLRLCIRTALMTFLVLSLLLSAFGLLFCSAILRALHTPGNVLPMASAYLMIYFLGLPFLFLYNMLSAMFNALGRSRVMNSWRPETPWRFSPNGIHAMNAPTKHGYQYLSLTYHGKSQSQS